MGIDSSVYNLKKVAQEVIDDYKEENENEESDIYVH